MRKLDSLRAAVVAALPELATDPARLRVWIDRGALRATQTANLSFGFAYRANLLVMDMASDIAVLALAVNRWLRANQPDLLGSDKDAATIEADVLDNGTVDVLIQIDITEMVRVAAEGGGDRIDYLPEPDPMFGDDLGFAGTDPVPPLRSVSVTDGGQLAPGIPPWEA